MAKKRNEEAAGSRATTTDDEGLPTPVRRLRLKLKSLDDVARECARLYRETKSGRIAPDLAGKLGFLINTLHSLLVDTDLEKRVKALEEIPHDEH